MTNTSAGADQKSQGLQMDGSCAAGQPEGVERHYHAQEFGHAPNLAPEGGREEGGAEEEGAGVGDGIRRRSSRSRSASWVPDTSRLVLDADQIARACARMAHQILEANRGAEA